MSHFLVTGGAGFIGSALVRGLLSQGASRVTVVDNLLTGHARNLEGLSGPLDFRQVDIRDYDALAAAMQATSGHCLSCGAPWGLTIWRWRGDTPRRRSMF